MPLLLFVLFVLLGKFVCCVVSLVFLFCFVVGWLVGSAWFCSSFFLLACFFGACSRCGVGAVRVLFAVWC